MGVRKNQNKLSQPERARFVAAVKKMKTDRLAAYNYDKFVRLHAAVAASNDPDQNPAHRGPAFCPWHRYLLVKFEQDLQAADRQLGNDGSLMLPYWDWTRDHPSRPDRQRAGVWHEDFMGGPGSPVSGSFSSWTLAPPNATGRLQRGLGSGSLSIADTLPRAAEVQRALASEGFDCPPFDAVRSAGGAGLPAPPAPAATGAAGGTLAAGTYRVVTTYVNAPVAGLEGETRPSPETLVCLGGGCTPANTHDTITVGSPPARPGALGYRVYLSAADGVAGSETRQGGLTAIGVPTTIMALAAGRPRPRINTTSSFRNLLEGWVSSRSQAETHNRVHLWVGGSMMPASSPDDPIFFLHHCNIDRLWALWQLRHPGENYPEVVPRVGGPGNRAEGLRDFMPPWRDPPEQVRPIDVLNHTAITLNGRSLGYTYDTDPPGLSVNVGT